MRCYIAWNAAEDLAVQVLEHELEIIASVDSAINATCAAWNAFIAADGITQTASGVYRLYEGYEPPDGHVEGWQIGSQRAASRARGERMMQSPTVFVSFAFIWVSLYFFQEGGRISDTRQEKLLCY